MDINNFQVEFTNITEVIGLNNPERNDGFNTLFRQFWERTRPGTPYVSQGGEMLTGLRVDCSVVNNAYFNYITNDAPQGRYIVVINFNIYFKVNAILGENQANQPWQGPISLRIPYYQSSGENSGSPGIWFPYVCMSSTDDRDVPNNYDISCVIPWVRTQVPLTRYSKGLIVKFHSEKGFNIIRQTNGPNYRFVPQPGKENYLHNYLIIRYLNQEAQRIRQPLLEFRRDSHVGNLLTQQRGPASIMNRFNNFLSLLVNRYMFTLNNTANNPWLTPFINLTNDFNGLEQIDVRLTPARLSLTKTYDIRVGTDREKYNMLEELNITLQHCFGVPTFCNNKRENRYWEYIKEISFYCSELFLQLFVIVQNATPAIRLRNVGNLIQQTYYIKIIIQTYKTTYKNYIPRRLDVASDTIVNNNCDSRKLTHESAARQEQNQ
jgi:hypothetical protein